MRKLKAAALALAEILARGNGVPGFPSTDPGKTFNGVPPKEVRSGLEPWGIPSPKADTSKIPAPTVAGIVAGVAVETVVAGRPRESQAAIKPLGAGGRPGTMIAGELLLPGKGTSRRAKRWKTGSSHRKAS